MYIYIPHSVISKVNQKQKPSFCLTFLYAFVDFRNNMLVHHKFIQNNEIHMKIGGDHGGGSLKMSYQIANVQNSNSTDNTIVFSIFERLSQQHKHWADSISRTSKGSSKHDMEVRVATVF